THPRQYGSCCTLTEQQQQENSAALKSQRRMFHHQIERGNPRRTFTGMAFIEG
ncbi:hypothetical protein PQQ46_004584, partial [Escherichia coli]